jgi:DNA phosphorothioation-dependent restriction protein DptF
MEQTLMLKEALSLLKESSKAAIADADGDSFDEIKSYLHLKRDIEEQLTLFLESVKSSNTKKLFLVCGNVGDGKSHLLASIRMNRPDLLEFVTMHNDATESSEPNKSYIDELNIVLEPFSDKNIRDGSEKVVLAINLGTLNNFLSADSHGQFSKLTEYVKAKKILEIGDITPAIYEEASPFQFVNFCDHNLFYLTAEGPVSGIIETAIKKIVSIEGPFYTAYKKQKAILENEKCPICYNYEILRQPGVRRKVAELIIECIIKGEVIVSIRALYNFIYELIIPIDLEPLNSEMLIKRIKKYSDKDFLQNILPNYLFGHPELSELFAHIQQHDPSYRRGEVIDEAIVELVVSDNPFSVLDKFISIDEVGNELKEVLLTSSPDATYIDTFIRSAFFWPKDDSGLVANPIYKEFMVLMFDWYSGNAKNLKPLYRCVQKAVVSWRGQAGAGKINVDVGRQQLDYRISEAIEVKPEPLSMPKSTLERITEFNTTIPVRFRVDGELIHLAINYNIFALVTSIDNGYRPTSLDHSNFVVFDEFVKSVVAAGTGQKQMFITESANKKQFVLEIDEFGDFCFWEAVQ